MLWVALLSHVINLLCWKELWGSQDTASRGSGPNLHVPLYSQPLSEEVSREGQLALVLDSAVPKQDRSC